jgi:hypothetical protein
MRKAALVAIALLWSAQALAEQAYGLEVYPGAKPDAAVQKSLAKMGFKNARTYRTSDPVPKVADFYRKQKLKEMPGADARGAAFSADKANVTIQNPWMDMENGKMMNDTLISIVRK